MIKRQFPYRTSFGIALALLGALMLANALGVLPFFSFGITAFLARLWPFALLALGFLQLKNNRVGSGVLLSFLAIVLFSASFFGTGFFTIIWPFLLIALGLRLCSTTQKADDPCGQERLEEVSLFTHVKRRMTSSNLSGGNIYCLLGGVTVDAREAKLSETGGTLTISCVMGSVRIAVPSTFTIVPSGRGLLGSWKVPASSRTETDGPVLRIRGVSMLGNVEVIVFPE